MDKLGDVTGMSADKLSAWSFIADKAGVSTETLANATIILEKGLFDSKGELALTGKALEDFGVNIHDANGNVKDQGTLMNDIAKKYASFGTQVEKVDFLTNIFGRSGAKLNDVFDTLAKEGGIDAVTDKVKKLGLTIDPAQYEQFQRGLNEVQLTLTGLANAFTGPLLPAAQKLLDIFTNWLQSDWVVGQIKNISFWLGRIADDIANAFHNGDWSKVQEDLKQLWLHIEHALEETEIEATNWVNQNGTAFINGIIDGLTGDTAAAVDGNQSIAGLGGNLVNAIVRAVKNANWSKLGGAMTEKLNEQLNLLGSTQGGQAFEGLAIMTGLFLLWKNLLAPIITGLIGIVEAVKLVGLVGATALLAPLALLVATGVLITLLIMHWRELGDIINNIGKIMAITIVNMTNAFMAGLKIMGDALGNFWKMVSNNPIVGWNVPSAPAASPTIKRKASGGFASGSTWVGERGPERVDLPSGSFVNSSSASMNQGFDYYKFAAILAVEFAKARD